MVTRTEPAILAIAQRHCPCFSWNPLYTIGCKAAAALKALQGSQGRGGSQGPSGLSVEVVGHLPVLGEEHDRLLLVIHVLVLVRLPG